MRVACLGPIDRKAAILIVSYASLWRLDGLAAFAPVNIIRLRGEDSQSHPG